MSQNPEERLGQPADPGSSSSVPGSEPATPSGSYDSSGSSTSDSGGNANGSSTAPSDSSESASGASAGPTGSEQYGQNPSPYGDAQPDETQAGESPYRPDRKSTRLNSSHVA